MIKINEIINKKEVNKATSAAIIFQAMQAALKEDPKLKKFILDFAKIETCSKYVFQDVFKIMKIEFSGEYVVEVINANEAIAKSFQQSIAPE